MRRIITFTFVIFLLAGCATVSRPLDVEPIARQTFGPDAKFKVDEVEYTGWIRRKLSDRGSRDDYALWTDMQTGSGKELNLVVWSGSSSSAAAALLRALKYPGMERLQYLRLLFVGDAKDAKRIRPALEATGARFYFHQR